MSLRTFYPLVSRLMCDIVHNLWGAAVARLPSEHMLHTFRDTLLSEVRMDQPDLNLRQLAVLLVAYQTDELLTVRGLAKHLHIGKPAVTRALDRLEELDLIRRVPDLRDRRSVILGRTKVGMVMMVRVRAAAADAAFRSQIVR